MLAQRQDEPRVHWTQALFVDHPELSIPAMEVHSTLAMEEAAQVSKILRKQLQCTRLEKTKVLDMCCGIGTHSIALAKDGYEVVGFDLSRHCLKKAEQLANQNGLSKKKLRFYQGDLRQVFNTLTKVGESDFDAILSLGNSFGYYGEEDDLEFLRQLNRLAAPRMSVFILDVMNRNWLTKYLTPNGFSQISHKIQMDAKRTLNPRTSVVESEWKFYEKRGKADRSINGTKLIFSLNWQLRAYSFDELRKLLKLSGWKYLESYGSIRSLTQLNQESYHNVLVCTKGKARF
jgi:SAM-dependent methyltransferase